MQNKEVSFSWFGKTLWKFTPIFADCFDVTASVSLSEGFDVGVSADVGCLTDNLMDGSVTTGQGSNSDWGFFGDFW